MQFENGSDLYEIPEQNPILIKEERYNLSSIVFSQNGQYIFTGQDYEKTIFIWSCGGEFFKKITLPYVGRGVSNGVHSIALSRDHQQIIVGGRDRYIQSLEFQTGERKYCVTTDGFWGGLAPILAINDIDDQYVYHSSHNEFVLDLIKMRDFETGKFISNFFLSESSSLPTVPCARSYKSRSLFAAGHYQLNLLDNRSTKSGFQFEKNEKRITQIEFSHDDKRLITVDVGGIMNFFDIRNTKPFRKFDRYSKKITSMAISSDDRYIFFSNHNQIQVWDEKLEIFPKVPSFPSSILALSPKCHLVSADKEGNMQIWNFRDFLKSEAKSSGYAAGTPLIENWVLKTYLDVLKNPDSLSIDLLRQMFRKVRHVAEFQFPYTLTMIDMRQGKIEKFMIYSHIDECLVKLAKTCTRGSDYLADYRIILDSVFDNDIISKHRQYVLENQAIINTTIFDERLECLKQQLQILKKQVRINYENIKNIADDLKNLKDAITEKTKRDVYFGIAKIAFTFFGSSLIDSISAMIDFSDMIKLGSKIFKIAPNEIDGFLKSGIDSFKRNLDIGAAAIIKKVGYDPDQFLTAWRKAAIKLEVVKQDDVVLPPSRLPISDEKKLDHLSGVKVIIPEQKKEEKSNIRKRLSLPDYLLESTFLEKHRTIKDGQEIIFDEYKVKGDGHCGFHALGVSRQEAVKILNPLVEDQKMRSSIIEELLRAMDNFRTSNGEEIDPARFMDKEMSGKFIELYNELRNFYRLMTEGINKIQKTMLAEKFELPGGNSEENILNYLHLKSLPMIIYAADQKSVSTAEEKYKKKMREILESRDIFRAYVESYCFNNGSTGLWLGTTSMRHIAAAKKLGLYLWGINKSTGNLQLLPDSLPSSNPSSGSVNILIRGGHYNFLVEDQSAFEKKHTPKSPTQFTSSSSQASPKYSESFSSTPLSSSSSILVFRNSFSHVSQATPSIQSVPTSAAYKSDEKYFPMHYAIKMDKCKEVIADLIQVGHSINQNNSAGKAPIRIAAELGNSDMVKFLLVKGAVVTVEEQVEYLDLARKNAKQIQTSEMISLRK